jgi:hypothetical protein
MVNLKGGEDIAIDTYMQSLVDIVYHAYLERIYNSQ